MLIEINTKIWRGQQCLLTYIVTIELVSNKIILDQIPRTQFKQYLIRD